MERSFLPSREGGREREERRSRRQQREQQQERRRRGGEMITRWSIQGCKVKGERERGSGVHRKLFASLSVFPRERESYDAWEP